MILCSRREAFSLFSWEGGIVCYDRVLDIKDQIIIFIEEFLSAYRPKEA